MFIRAHVNINRIEYIILDTNRSWMRDSGPIIVKRENSGNEAIHFNFNGWAKYGNYRKDVYVPKAVAGNLQIPLVPAIFKNRHVVLEGGAIESNGRGTLITTEECLLDTNIQVRIPDLPGTIMNRFLPNI